MQVLVLLVVVDPLLLLPALLVVVVVVTPMLLSLPAVLVVVIVIPSSMLAFALASKAKASNNTYSWMPSHPRERLVLYKASRAKASTGNSQEPM